MEISARLFGVNSWSILVPQALEGWPPSGCSMPPCGGGSPRGPALLAGAVLALTPVAALMFRFNNPDALLALLLTGAAYATVRALEAGRTRWLVLAGTLIGFGFITKMLQALSSSSRSWPSSTCSPGRPGWVAASCRSSAPGCALVVSAGWWVAVVELTPAADRPYIGGSTDNSLLNLIFGYNGFGRLTGNETRQRRRAAAPGGAHVGPDRVDPPVQLELGGTDLVAASRRAGRPGRRALAVTAGPARTDRGRAALPPLRRLAAGRPGLVISLAQGIIHPYYTVALAPPSARAGRHGRRRVSGGAGPGGQPGCLSPRH